MYSKANYESSRRLNPKINDLIHNHKPARAPPQTHKYIYIQNRNQNKTILSSWVLFFFRVLAG
jgi:hypothetical protein